MTPNIEQQARRILVAQYVHDGWDEDSANAIAHSADEEITIRAIVRALTPTGENAKHVEVLRVMLNGDASRLNLQAYEREAIDAAIRALSAPDNAEAMFHLRSYGDVSEKELLALTLPAARVSVSDEDLALCAVAANRLDDVYHDGIYAAAIYRLVQAVKGEKARERANYEAEIRARIISATREAT